MKTQLFMLALVGALTACAQSPTAAPIARTRLPSPDKVTIHCPDCAEEGLLVNLWDTPQSAASGAKVQAQVPHGTPCDVADSGSNEGRTWLAVNCGGLNIGWVLKDLTK